MFLSNYNTGTGNTIQIIQIANTKVKMGTNSKFLSIFVHKHILETYVNMWILMCTFWIIRFHWHKVNNNISPVLASLLWLPVKNWFYCSVLSHYLVWLHSTSVTWLIPIHQTWHCSLLINSFKHLMVRIKLYSTVAYTAPYCNFTLTLDQFNLALKVIFYEFI